MTDIHSGQDGDNKAPPYLNLSQYCLSDHASRTPDKDALVVLTDASAAPSEIYTYASLQDHVLSALGTLLQHGTRGDRILVDLGNQSLFPIVFFGAMAGGLIPVPLSDQLTRTERSYIAADSGAALVVTTDPDRYSGLGNLTILTPETFTHKATPADYTDTRPEDPAFLIYTSGTSGKPKGVLHAHRSILGRRPIAKDWFDLQPSDRLLHAGAFNWSYTLGVGLMDPWAGGVTSLIFTGEKTPDVWPDLIEHHSITLFAAVPSLYRRILKYSDISENRMPSLRHGLCAGEALRPELYEAWKTTTGRELYEALGMSECSTYISSSAHTSVRPGSPGKPQTGRRVTALSEENPAVSCPSGEIGLLAIHRSEPGLMLRYWQAPDETENAFTGDWFLTGDRVSFDEEDYVWYAGRADDVMNAFGYRVAAEEVERTLSDHPLISEIAVTTISVNTDVEVIAAFIIPQGPKTPDLEDLKDWASSRLASYKCPREWVFVDDLPRTPSGKLMRKALKQHTLAH